MPTAKRCFRHAKSRDINLAKNEDFQFASRHALSVYHSDAVYSFIPKIACSTMRYSLAIAHGMIDGPEHFNWIHVNNMTFRASLAELIKAKYTFAILRDPFRRIASCYLDKMTKKSSVCNDFHRQTNRQMPPGNLTFREFISGLKSNLRGNEHWRPQMDFLIYEEYDDLFCLEAFSDATRTLQERLQLDIHDARNLSKHGTDQFRPLANDAFYADTPAHTIALLKSKGRVPRPEQLYDTELAMQTGLLYADDLTFYSKAFGRHCLFPQIARSEMILGTLPEMAR